MPGPSPANLLSVFPESLSARLFAHAKPAKLAADEVLFLAGDPGDGCYRVEQGLLKVSMIAPTGAERILAIVGPGAIVGELSTIDGLPRSASVAAVRDSELTFVSRAAFQAFADDHPEVYRHLVTLLAARLRDTDGVVAAGSFLPLKGRVARALLDLAEAFGQDVGQGRILIRQKVSQSDVAAMAGIARENVSRILNDWIRDKLVSRLSGYYCLENKAEAQTRERAASSTLRRARASARAARLRRHASVSVMSWPSATKSALRGEVRRHARPTVRPGSGSAKRRQLHALVAQLHIDGDARQQRDAVAVRHHLHHGREAGRAEARRRAARSSRTPAPGRAGSGPPRAGSAAACRCRRRRRARAPERLSVAGTASRNGSSNSRMRLDLGVVDRQRQHDDVERAARAALRSAPRSASRAARLAGPDSGAAAPAGSSAAHRARSTE